MIVQGHGGYLVETFHERVDALELRRLGYGNRARVGSW